jgi:signal transduction histidine kinase
VRARFTLWFAGAALVPIVAAAVVAWLQISAGYRDDFERSLRAAHATARRELDRVRQATVNGADAAAQSPVFAAVLVELAKGGEPGSVARRELRGSGAALMRSHGLDVLTVTAQDGTVLAAPHFTAHIDETDPEPRRLARAGAPAVAWAKVIRDGQVERILVVQAARVVADRGQEIVVLAGRELGRELLAPLAAGGVEARLVDAGGAEVHSTTARWAALAGAPSLDLVLDGVDGAAVAHLVVAVSDVALRARLSEVAAITAALAGAAVLAAALLGWLVARRMTRDLDALLAGVRAVARGDLDARVEARGGDEIGRVAEAFNVMTRDLRDAKEQLVQAERVAAWQEIAKSLAHEIKNPLTPIQMSVETLRKTWSGKHPSFGEIFEEATRTVLDEVQRLKRIVGEFSQFARMPRAERRPQELNEIVGSALALYRGSVKVVSELGPGLPPVEADRDQLTQVVLNLLENARDAVASRGSDESVGRITVRTRLSDRGMTLEVEDNGPGFDPTLAEKLFAPYFTTKDAGTGLGLAIVRRIVVDHGGRVAAISEPGRGARFVIELPALTTR